MFAGNAIALIVESLRALIQKLREEFAVHKEVEHGDAEVIESGIKTLDRTDGELIALEKEEELIQADEDSSDEGKRKMMVKAVNTRYEELALVQKAAKQQADAANEARRQLTATPKAQTNEVTDYLIGAEIRQRMSRMPQAERMKVFAEAMVTKNAAVQRAIANDPLNEELIPREYVERVVQEHAQQTEGAQWQRLQTLEFVAERLTLLANALEYRFGNYGNTPTFPTPPIGKADLKVKNPHEAPLKSKVVDKPPTNAPACG